jgi:anaerobic magnesium-protoporphyrin IX monomethyl ester cyclase
MKILLMTPITEFVDQPPNIPDLGLGYIASSLIDNGHNVFIKDWSMNPSANDFKSWLTAKMPEVIGVRVFTKDVAAAKRTIAIIREINPETIVVIGGPHPSAVDPVELMEDFTECDFAIRGEAEKSFPLLLNEIFAGEVNRGKGFLETKELKTIPGLVWRNTDKIDCNPISFVHDLDRFNFPPWEIINLNDYSTNMFGSEIEGATAPIITTRGCPGKCTFCSAFNVNGRKIRSRSPENVIKEMLIL